MSYNRALSPQYWPEKRLGTHQPRSPTGHSEKKRCKNFTAIPLALFRLAKHLAKTFTMERLKLRLGMCAIAILTSHDAKLLVSV